jgi:hypothetical protein
MTQRCAACGSNELLRRTRLFKRASWTPGEISLDVPIPGFAGSGTFRSDIRAVICVACGHVHLQAVDLAELRAAYAEQQRTALSVTQDVSPDGSV